MLLFRRMKIDDLDFIYSDNNLKALLTVPPLGDKFGVLIEENNIIRGGITGYTKGWAAVFQMLKIKDFKYDSKLIDGLLRAAIHMLDLEEIKVVFTEFKEEEPYISIGFREFSDSNCKLDLKLDKVILDDISHKPFAFLNIEEFFNRPGC